MKQNTLRLLFLLTLLALLLTQVHFAALAEETSSDVALTHPHTVEDFFGAGPEEISPLLHGLMDDFGGPDNMNEILLNKWPGASGSHVPVWDDFTPVQPYYIPKMGAGVTPYTEEETGEQYLMWFVDQMDLRLEDWQITILDGDRQWELVYLPPFHFSELFPAAEYGVDGMEFTRYPEQNVRITVCVDVNAELTRSEVCWQDDQYLIEWHWLEDLGHNTLRLLWKDRDQGFLMLFYADTGELIFTADGNEEKLNQAEESIISSLTNYYNGNEE